MQRAIEEFIGDLREPLRDALLLSARHSYATCAERLGIDVDDVVQNVDDAHELVTRRLLGTTGWEDAVARQVALMRIDQVAIRLQKRRESVWHRAAAILPVEVPSPPALRAVTALGLASVTVLVAVRIITGPGTSAPGDNPAGPETAVALAEGAGEVLPPPEPPFPGDEPAGVPARAEADDYGERTAEMTMAAGPPDLRSGEGSGFAARPAAAGSDMALTDLWPRVESQNVGTAAGADILGAASANALTEALMHDTRELWACICRR